MRILEVNGLIIVRAGPHGGPHVTDVSATDFSRTMSLFFEVAGFTYAEVLNARIEVEPLLARMAAENITDEGRAELKEALEHHTASATMWPRSPISRRHNSFTRPSPELAGTACSP